MELKTAIEILDYHQEWRLGKREDMIHEPKKLTEALDIVLKQVKNLTIPVVSSSFKKIIEYSERAGALFLIEQHTIGSLRNEGDLDNAKHHSMQTINFIEDLLLNIDGTLDDKIKFLSKIKNEIPKFSGKR